MPGATEGATAADVSMVSKVVLDAWPDAVADAEAEAEADATGACTVFDLWSCINEAT